MIKRMIEKNKKILLIIIFIVFWIILPCKTFADENDCYFYSNTCLDCKAIEEEIKPFLEKNNIQSKLLEEDEISYIKKFLEQKDIDKKIKTPILIYNSEIYIGKNEILELINDDETISLPILFLGFIDGLNPCAISILMIFSSFLITLDKKKQLLIIGLNFIIGETLTNLLLGFGILKITEILSNFDIFTKILYIITLCICLYVIIINFIDIINGIKKKKEIKNILPIKVRYKINEILSKNITSKIIILISFLLGIVIALLEFGCTGQVYLPSIIYMSESGINVILGLIIYNLMFALPLLIFLALALIFNPSSLQENVMKKSYIIKILTNIILVILFTQILTKLI